MGKNELWLHDRELLFQYFFFLLLSFHSCVIFLTHTHSHLHFTSISRCNPLSKRRKENSNEKENTMKIAITKKSENTVRQRFETAIKVDAQIPNDTLNPVVAEQIIDPVPDFRWVCSLTKEAPLLKITLWWSCPVKNLGNIHPPQDVHCIMV